MAVLAQASITLSFERDILSHSRFYLLQSSSSTPPAKPTTVPPPAAWDDTEPTYSTSGTYSLYVVDLTVYSDDTFEYSDVSLSTAYEAAKAAHNAAVAAQSAADSKTKAFYQTSAPASSVGLNVNDIWYDTDDGNSMHKWNGTQWVLQQFGTNAIVAGSITTAKLAAQDVYTNFLLANFVTAAQASFSTLSAITADIGTVTAGILTSSDWDYDYDHLPIYSTAGMRISLNDKYIRTPNFAMVNGNLYARNGTFSGSVTASSGTVGGFTISSTANTEATASGGHVYTNSLYTHSSDNDYEYEAGMTGGGAYNNAAFYIKRMTKNAQWSSSDHVFYVRNDGYLYSTRGAMAGWNIGEYQISSTSSVTSGVSDQTQYAVFIRSKNSDLSNPTGTTKAFGVSSRTYNGSTYGSWSDKWYVDYAGNMTASAGTLGPWTLDANSIKRGGGYNSSTANSMYFGTSGLSVKNKFVVDPDGNTHIKGGSLYIDDLDSSDLAGIYFPSGSIKNTGSGMVISDDYELDLRAESTNGYGYMNLYAARRMTLQVITGSTKYPITIVSSNLYVTDTGTVDATGDYRRKLTGYTRGTAPSSALYSSYAFRDKDDKAISYMQSALWTNGSSALRLLVETPTSAGGNASGLVLEKNTSGTLTCTIGGSTTIDGTLQTSGNINIVSSAASSYAVGVQNSVGKVQLYMSSGGAMGVYDSTNSRWIIYENSSGEIVSPRVYSNTGSGSTVVVDSNGKVCRTSSARRYKHDIKALTDYRKILDIPVVSFVYNDDCLSKEDQRYGQTLPGFIAEDVAEHYAIAADRCGNRVEDWNLRFIVPPMLAVEQDHEKRLAALEAENATLKEKIAQLMGGAG